MSRRLTNRAGFILWTLLLPAGFWWTVAGIIYTTALGWWGIAEMSCMDCTFRGHGAGGSF